MKRKYRKIARKSSRFVSANDETLHFQFNREELLAMLNGQLEVLAGRIGRVVAMGMLEDEALTLCGEPGKHRADRQQTRYGYDPGWVVMNGQKLAIERPRVRSTTGKGEVVLRRYGQMQDPNSMPKAVLKRMLRGVSSRNYEGVVDTAEEGFGIKKSSVGRALQRSLAAEVRELMTRRWDGVRFLVIYVDATPYAGESMVVALGVTERGDKHILALRQGATENARVCTDLLSGLTERGVTPEAMTLFVLDGGKALRAAAARVWGEYALVQRCQLHKRRNIQEYLNEAYWPELRRRLNEAYQATDYELALAALRDTVQWLKGINPDAAHSLEEGLVETLTVVWLQVPALLRKSLSNTNVIESAIGSMELITRRVTNWQDGAMRQQWCGGGLLHIEEHFHRVPGSRYLPQLREKLDALAHEKGLDAKTHVA